MPTPTNGTTPRMDANRDSTTSTATSVMEAEPDQERRERPHVPPAR